MLKSKNARYAMFGLLYFSQGAILSYFTALNSLYLLSFNLSMTQVGLVGTIAIIPFILKIFLGILSDRVNLFHMGHRKPFIIIGLLMQSICLIFVPMINPGTQFWLFVLLAFLVQSGMALYDTCTDGLALDTIPESEEGTIQGFMVGGRALGVVLISSLIGLIAQTASWPSAFYALALLSLLPLPFVLRVKEANRTSERKFDWKAFKAFSNRSIIFLGVLGALYSLVINAANQIVNPFLQAEFGINLQTAGFITTTWGIGVVIGGLTGGKLTDRIGQRQSVKWAIGISFFSILALALIVKSWLAWPLVVAFGVAYGYYETVYFAISMKSCDPRIAASMFSILMAIANVGTAIGLGMSGALSDSIGYRWTFVAIGAMNLLAVPLLSFIFGSASSRQQSSVGA